MKTPKAAIKKSKKQLWLKRIFISLMVIMLLPIGLFTIGWLNRDSVIDVLQEWYAENTSGTLTIGKVNARFLSGFPNVVFTLKDIKHTNTDSISDQVSRLQIDEAKLVIGAGKLLRGKIVFKNIAIKNAEFHSEVISTKPLMYHQQLKKEKQQNRIKGFNLPDWVNPTGAKVLLENVKYITKDSVLNKYFNLDIHKIKGAFKGDHNLLVGNSDINITVNNLGFNTNKGSFFNGAIVKGVYNFSVDLENDLIEVPEFPLKIDDQTFQLSANFDLSDITEYRFSLENPNSDFKALKGLLTDSISAKLKSYEIQRPLKTHLRLLGKFAYGNNPDINADFSTTDNEVIVADKFHFKNTSFSGNLTNDLYKTDSLRREKKSVKDFKITFDTLVANLETIHVDIYNSYFQSTPEALNFIDAYVHLNGNNEDLAAIIETDNFDFKGGKFLLDAHFSGDIQNPYEFLNKASGLFNLKNTQVILKKNGLQLPIQSITVSLERENSVLRELTINLPNGEDLVFQGNLKNIAGILSKTPTVPTTSQISLNSKNLNINDVIGMAKQFVPKSSAAVDDRRNLHETLEAIYSQFHPQFRINIGSLTYNDVVINALKSNMELINSETILLRNFNFNYGEAITNLKGNVRVHGPLSRLKDAIYINAEASSSGPISVFKELFNIELFRIDSGDFKFNGHVTGNVKELSELMDNARGDLTLTNTSLHYEPAKMDITIDSLSLFVDNSDILLKEFNLQIDELHSINLDGRINQFPVFLLDNKEGPASVSLNLDAPFIDGDDLLGTINSFKNEDKSKVHKSKKALHSIFKDLNRFNPEIQIAVDSLKYKGLITQNINAQVFFENDSILKLNHLDLHFKETVAYVHGEINAHSSQVELLKDNPFDLDFSVEVKGKSEDLNDYLKTTNFVFKSGDFEFVGNYKAESTDLTLLNAEGFGDLKIAGTTGEFKAAGLQFPIDSLHVEINNDVAKLKTLDIKLPGKSQVFFSGTIDNFSEFINGPQDFNQHKSDFSIYSPYLDSSDIQKFIKSSKSNSDKTDAQPFNFKEWQETLLKINRSFYPTIAIEIDTLKHDKFNVTKFESELLFVEDNFHIEDMQFKSFGGTIAVDLELGIADVSPTPVTLEMSVRDIDLKEFLSSVNYFDTSDLKQADSIKGQLNYTIKAHGMLDERGKLNLDSLNGTVYFELEDLALYNYEPIMENVPLMRAERFKNLRFQPIVQTFEIKDGEIIIPRTEIQSTALHLFAEGRLKLKEHMNIWISVPWKNLKNNDGLSLPEKTSYKNAGAKFFLQLVQDQNSEKARKQKLKVKFKLGNRKLKKMRRRLKQN
ncbi:AsmA-like C-terminal region-containing protein [Gelidibacter sp.]|uniref:AsmA-like C-terminal region-containing protein n=1 Tax=Gelidibacter sp. TaxID=2018083 RepID=UPI002BA52155|nr:AsmA-like C-terminal region-containing protein [Gelidibacter sp.]HUH29488.1 AsmA-like C-terminal region-containing protein [Gelidibacter sp.]